MNTLSNTQRAQIVNMICEGMSIRATARVVGVSKNTVAKLVVDLGTAASIYQDRAFRGLACKRIECDEIWSFVGAKERNVPAERAHEDLGSVWTWTALCSDSKLVVTWLVGSRDREDASAFLSDLASRLTERIQLSTDAWHAYKSVVPVVFRDNVDFATIMKTFGGGNEDRRYSPAECTGMEKTAIVGKPDMRKANTSFVERQNLSIRMGSRRYTRLTNAFSKKIENHIAATSLHFAFYNLCRPHGTLNKRHEQPTTPAMAARVEDHVWSATELVELLDRFAA